MLDVSFEDLKRKYGHYFVTALWSSGDDKIENFDSKYDLHDIDKSFFYTSVKDCKEFLEKAESLLDNESKDLDEILHDFWLTRNHHGAGFWDGDYIKGDELTTIAQSFKEVHLYITDDNTINGE